MFRSLSTSAMALIVAASPVFAQITPAQAWDDLVAQYDKMGYAVTVGNRDEAGDTLTLSDVTFAATQAGAEPGGTAPAVTIQAPRIVLSETGGGDVRMVSEGDYTGRFSIEMPDTTDADDTPATDGADADAGADGDADGDGDGAVAPAATPATKTTGIDVVIKAPGNETIISGAVGAMVYTITYPNLDILVTPDDLAEGSEPIRFGATNLTGSYQVTDEAGEGGYRYDLKATDMVMAMDMVEPMVHSPVDGAPSGSSRVKVDVTASDVTTQGEGQMMGAWANAASPLNAALNAGMTGQGTLTFASLRAVVDATENNSPVGAGEFNSGPLALDFALDKDGLRYGAQGKGGSVTMTGRELPFPVNYSVENVQAALSLPLMKSDTPQPFTFTYGFDGLTLGEGLWDQIDRSASLPRDPASVSVDLSGELMVTRDLFDEAFAAQMTAATTVQPGQETLTPNRWPSSSACKRRPAPISRSPSPSTASRSTRWAPRPM